MGSVVHFTGCSSAGGGGPSGAESAAAAPVPDLTQLVTEAVKSGSVPPELRQRILREWRESALEAGKKGTILGLDAFYRAQTGKDGVILEGPVGTAEAAALAPLNCVGLNAFAKGFESALSRNGPVNLGGVRAAADLFEDVTRALPADACGLGAVGDTLSDIALLASENVPAADCGKLQGIVSKQNLESAQRLMQVAQHEFVALLRLATGNETVSQGNGKSLRQLILEGASSLGSEFEPEIKKQLDQLLIRLSEVREFFENEKAALFLAVSEPNKSLTGALHSDLLKRAEGYEFPVAELPKIVENFIRCLQLQVELKDAHEPVSRASREADLCRLQEVRDLLPQRITKPSQGNIPIQGIDGAVLDAQSLEKWIAQRSHDLKTWLRIRDPNILAEMSAALAQSAALAGDNAVVIKMGEIALRAVGVTPNEAAVRFQQVHLAPYMSSLFAAGMDLIVARAYRDEGQTDKAHVRLEEGIRLVRDVVGRILETAASRTDVLMSSPRAGAARHDLVPDSLIRTLLIADRIVVDRDQETRDLRAEIEKVLSFQLTHAPEGNGAGGSAVSVRKVLKLLHELARIKLELMRAEISLDPNLPIEGNADFTGDEWSLRLQRVDTLERTIRRQFSAIGEKC